MVIMHLLNSYASWEHDKAGDMRKTHGNNFQFSHFLKTQVKKVELCRSWFWHMMPRCKYLLKKWSKKTHGAKQTTAWPMYQLADVLSRYWPITDQLYRHECCPVRAHVTSWEIIMQKKILRVIYTFLNFQWSLLLQCTAVILHNKVYC